MSFQPEAKYINENNLQYAYRVIRTNILRLNLKPGDPIDEKELADSLGISRTPVHDAILLLRDERLVDVQPKIRSSVSLIDRNLVLEGGEIRYALERLVLNRACGRLTPEASFSIQENLMRQRFLIENNEYPVMNQESHYRFQELDNQFHFCFYSAVGMEWTWKNQLKICSHIDRLRHFNDVESEITNRYRLQLVHEHEKIYDAVKNNTPELLPEILYTHVNGKEHLRKISEKYTDYFC